MSQGNVILRFENLSFYYHESKPILEEVNFSVREDSKITIMGQNGAGKSTIFKLICGAAGKTDVETLKPQEGKVHIRDNAKIAIALQVMPKKYFDLTITEYFATAFEEKKYNLDKLIANVFAVVDLNISTDIKIKNTSGGQQARLLLAYALIQEPDVLLLDEPTNNLDQAGIDHLTGFLMMYDKTVIVISHEADFLNAFTEGVLNVDVRTKKVEQYVGNYFNVVDQIQAQIDREQKKNAQLLKNIQDRKDKMNTFSHKGGKMRKLASKMREEVARDEANMVEVKQDDRTINNFIIPAQEWSKEIAKITSVSTMQNGEVQHKEVDLSLWKGHKMQIVGPNGIGKSTLLKKLALDPDHNSAMIDPKIKVGYYRQDFSGLDFDQTAYDSLASMMDIPDNETIYFTAAQFLLSSSALKTPVGALSEGQKGLLCYARFVLQEPGLLILDEPSNHINFRHLPVIAKAVNNYEGALIIVSHMREFMEHIDITHTLHLGKE